MLGSSSGVPRGAALLGKHKWLGGAFVKDAYFAVPSHARSVLRVDPLREEVSLLDEDVGAGKYKWLRAVATEDAVFGIPCCADRVLRIDAATGAVETLRKLPEEDDVTSWRWHGAQQSPTDGCIYAPPANSRHVLKVDPATLACDLLTIDGLSPTTSQFYGGILDDFGAVWGVPFRSGAVLKAHQGRARAIAVAEPGFEQNHHGGLKCAVTGAVFGFPANSDKILRIDPRTDTVSHLEVPGPRGKYQWGGGVQCPETGVIYGIPSDAPDVLRVDPISLRVSRFGADFFVPYQKNKFQNALRGPDGKFYAIPCDADYVLQLDPGRDALARIRLPPGLPPAKDKFQGGFVFRNTIWAIPENADFVLKLDLGAGGSPPAVELLGCTTDPRSSTDIG